MLGNYICGWGQLRSARENVVTSEVKWGVPAVTQVDLFGRHPTRGFLLLESVTESD